MASRRILGIDPGLTRCGVGVIEVDAARRLRLIHVGVVRTPPGQDIAQRLLVIGDEIERLLDEHRPDTLSIERVFAQQNLSTVMGVAQISGIALREAASRGIPAQLHTPTEAKAAVSGYGAADKAQVTAMVQRILRLDEPPRPADAADALALAICAAWRPASGASSRPGTSAARTPAQEAWLAAERAAKASRRRLQ